MSYRPDLPPDERAAELRLLRTRALFTGDERTVRRLDSKIAWLEAGSPDVLPKSERQPARRRRR
jgi:hypothetical protein